MLFLHLLFATVWIGGHLVLALGWLPRALRARDPAIIEAFEKPFERIGIPALIGQVVTGVVLARRYVPDIERWLAFDSRAEVLVGLKLLLLAATAALAVHARFRLIPNLTPERLPLLAVHIVGVTMLSIAFAAVGVSFRGALGW